MGIQEIDALIKQAANEIRKYVAGQKTTWQRIPYWTLESEGRGGWQDNWGLPYRYGVFGLDIQWPHQLFVELSTGRLVCNDPSGVYDAPDDLIVTTYTSVGSLFDAKTLYDERVDRASNGRDTYNKRKNDLRRAQMRAQLQVPLVWTSPAKPIAYSYRY